MGYLRMLLGFIGCSFRSILVLCIIVVFLVLLGVKCSHWIKASESKTIPNYTQVQQMPEAIALGPGQILEIGPNSIGSEWQQFTAVYKKAANYSIININRSPYYLEIRGSFEDNGPQEKRGYVVDYPSNRERVRPLQDVAAGQEIASLPLVFGQGTFYFKKATSDEPKIILRFTGAF